MLYWLTALSDGGDFFNLFRYITFRAGGAFLTALGLWVHLWTTPSSTCCAAVKAKASRFVMTAQRRISPKQGTPTMGGLADCRCALTFSTLLWARWDNPFIWIVLFVTLSFAAIGFADDYAKVSKANDWLACPAKCVWGWALSLLRLRPISRRINHPEALQNQLALPVFKDTLINLGYLFIPFSMIVIVGAANAVNLTDGLDGLAIMPVMIAAGALGRDRLCRWSCGFHRLSRRALCAGDG